MLAENIAHNLCNSNNTAPSIGIIRVILKSAQVSPLFKKNNSLDKGNYKPVSVLPCISKIYERAIHDQLMDFLEKKHFHPLLSALRPGFGCQTPLLKIIEDWKKSSG